jgi:hypothetical protein
VLRARGSRKLMQFQFMCLVIYGPYFQLQTVTCWDIWNSLCNAFSNESCLNIYIWWKVFSVISSFFSFLNAFSNGELAKAKLKKSDSCLLNFICRLFKHVRSDLRCISLAQSCVTRRIYRDDEFYYVALVMLINKLVID